MRGAGGVVIREGLLMGVFGGAAFGKGKDEAFLSQEGWTLGNGDLEQKMKMYEGRHAVFITALRQPVDRILSRYWYEGRWKMGAKPEKDAPRSIEVSLSLSLSLSLSVYVCMYIYYWLYFFPLHS